MQMQGKDIHALHTLNSNMLAAINNRPLLINHFWSIKGNSEISSFGSNWRSLL